MSNKIYKRTLLNKIGKWLERPEIIVITGPRQVGKTFLAGKIIPKVIGADVEYFNFENFDTRELFQKNPNEFIRNILNKNKIYVFDEFQKIPEFTSYLKVAYDRDKNNFPKIFLTGSSSCEIRDKIAESLVGQCISFNLFSLSFLERFDYPTVDFLENIAQDPNFKIEVFKKSLFFEQKKISQSFEEYLLLGGYPELGELDGEKKWEKLKSIIQKILEKDLQSLVKNEHLFSSKKLLEILAYRIGNLISFENLASELQLGNKTIKNLAAVLEGLFFIEFIYPKANFANEYKKAPKVYFHDLGIRNELVKLHNLPSDSSQLGGLVENFVFNQLRRYCAYKKDFKINFWQDYNGNEVDFILSSGSEIISIESKYRKSQEARVSVGVQNFIKKYNPQFHITVTYDYFGEEKIGGCRIFFIPAYAFGLLV